MKMHAPALHFFSKIANTNTHQKNWGYGLHGIYMEKTNEAH